MDMTKEQAIDLLDNLIGFVEDNHGSDYDEALKIAIKALEQELSDDCISRQAVLGKIKEVCFSEEWIQFRADKGSNGQRDFLINYIEQLPSVTPQQRWIPISEELPKDRDWYLGVFKESDTGWINPLPYICCYMGNETKATTRDYWILRGFTDRDEHIDYYFNLECVAWRTVQGRRE